MPPQPSAQTLHLRLTLEGSELEAAVSVPSAPSPRTVLLPILHNLTDAITALATRSAESHNENISCKKGCDACCRQMVPLSATEAQGLHETLAALPAQQRSRIQKRFAAGLAALSKNELLARLQNRHQLNPDQLHQLDRDYFAQNIPCPFLENHACSIHKSRPLACREFLVTSPAEFCRDPADAHIRQLPLATKPSRALQSTELMAWLPLILALESPPPAPAHSPALLLQQILNAL